MYFKFVCCSDFRKLARDFVGINKDVILSNCIDLRDLAKNNLPEERSWSLQLLVEKVVRGLC